MSCVILRKSIPHRELGRSAAINPDSHKWFPLGLAEGMLLHFLANFPIFLMKSRLFGWSESVWSILVSLCLAGCFFATLILLAAMHFGTGELRRIIFGKALCPSCRTAYNRPFFGFNAGMKRYERCPACGKWHWIDARDNVAAVSSAEQSESSL